MNDASLVLYGTSGCHLCDIAESLLLPWVESGLLVELIDIAEDDMLLERYGNAIPVLESANGCTLCWPFDALSVEQFLRNTAGVAS